MDEWEDQEGNLEQRNELVCEFAIVMANELFQQVDPWKSAALVVNFLQGQKVCYAFGYHGEDLMTFSMPEPNFKMLELRNLMVHVGDREFHQALVRLTKADL